MALEYCNTNIYTEQALNIALCAGKSKPSVLKISQESKEFQIERYGRSK